MSAETDQLARAYFAAAAERDVAAMQRFWNPAAVWDMVPLGKRLGFAETRDFFTGLFAALPDLTTRTNQVIAGDRRSAVQWHMSGTFDGEPFLGLRPTGRHIELDGCDCIEWEDGKLVSNTVYYDGASFARGVGMLPTIDSVPERAMYAAFNALTAVRRRLRS
jgi:steroid delta-isomerase-like uncharacterized protein